ncbi:hypothetical protein HMPREF0322_00735 [Desulfitobacterium hafniense DP7]|uniref:Uncharacterized protein n=1 Tax=Desulfitobacterium hafniense DP7 TaxID=537010 RepID=G9XIF8_DESHA|nr:hypothetical protein HMPREF0322_00735 [Desulfitobacterium hafniense DP7]
MHLLTSDVVMVTLYLTNEDYALLLKTFFHDFLEVIKSFLKLKPFRRNEKVGRGKKG